MQYTIGEISKRLDMQPSTLRYHDKEGLMPNVKRTNGGIRIFDDSDYELLTLIECLKRTGMSLKDIKVFIDWTLEGDSSIDKRLELIRKQRDAVLAQMDKLNETLGILDYKCWYYETAQKAGTCKIHDTLSADDIPQELKKAVSKLKGHQ